MREGCQSLLLSFLPSKLYINQLQLHSYWCKCLIKLYINKLLSMQQNYIVIKYINAINGKTELELLSWCNYIFVGRGTARWARVTVSFDPLGGGVWVVQGAAFELHLLTLHYRGVLWFLYHQWPRCPYTLEIEIDWTVDFCFTWNNTVKQRG